MILFTDHVHIVDIMINKELNFNEFAESNTADAE
jgi:hypothetical protein